MARKTTAAPPAEHTGTRLRGGTHGAPPWNGHLVVIDRYAFVVVDGTDGVHERCGRCDDSGHLPAYEGIAAGVCFACGGAGLGAHVPDGIDGARELVRRRLLARAARARRTARETADADAVRATWMRENSDLLDELRTVQAHLDRDPQLQGYVRRRLPALAGAAYNAAVGRIRLSPQALAEVRAELDEYRQEVAARQAIEQARAALRATSAHLGEIGRPLSVGGVLTSKRSIERYYGHEPTYSWMLLIQDADGNLIKCFTAAKWADGLTRGQQVTITGTVKAHTDFDGIAQTQLARPKLAAQSTAAAAGAR